MFPNRMPKMRLVTLDVTLGLNLLGPLSVTESSMTNRTSLKSFKLDSPIACFIKSVPIKKSFSTGWLTVLFFLFFIGLPVAASDMEGKGFLCVGVQGSGEDLFYGIIFDDGKVKTLAFERNDFGGDYIDPVTGNNELPYDFADSNIIRWQSGTYLHTMETRILKHTVDGGKKGFFRGLCFIENPAVIQMYLCRI